MSRPILVGYDPRTADRGPVSFGGAAARLTGAPLLIACVHVGVRPLAVSAGQTLSYAIAPAEDALVSDCSSKLRRLEEEMEAEGVSADYLTLSGDSAARVLHEAAEDRQAGLAVVGSGRRDRAPTILGSTAERLVHGAPCPIAVVPRGWAAAGVVETIGVAFIDSEEGREALRSAHALARRMGATLRVITVVKPRLVMYGETEATTPVRAGRGFDQVLGEHRVRAEQRTRQVVDAMLDDGARIEVDAFVGDPGDVLVDLSENLGLLVSGSRGYGPLRAVLLGSISRHVRRGVTVTPACRRGRPRTPRRATRDTGSARPSRAS
jgi:nucleotide-binding universal stress UspA family protein